MKVALFTATGAAVAAVGPVVPAIAQEQDDLDDSKLTIRDGDDVYEIAVEDVNGVRTVTTTNKTTGSVDRIVYDANSSTVYSTYTGETVQLTGDLAPAPEEQLPGTARSKTSYSSKRISFAQIKSTAGAIHSVAELTSVILAFVPQVRIVAALAGLVSYTANQVNDKTSPSTSHGIRVTIATTKYYRRGNNIPYRTVKEITKAEFY